MLLLLLSLNIGFYFKQQPLLVKTNPKKINPQCTGGGTLARKLTSLFFCLAVSPQKVLPGREEPQINNLIPREIRKASHFLNYNWQE